MEKWPEKHGGVPIYLHVSVRKFTVNHGVNMLLSNYITVTR